MITKLENIINFIKTFNNIPTEERYYTDYTGVYHLEELVQYDYDDGEWWFVFLTDDNKYMTLDCDRIKTLTTKEEATASYIDSRKQHLKEEIDWYTDLVAKYNTRLQELKDEEASLQG